MNTNSKELHGKEAAVFNRSCAIFEDMSAKIKDVKIFEKQKNEATDTIKQLCQAEADIVETVKAGIKDYETTEYMVSFAVNNLDKTELDIDMLRKELEKHDLVALIDLCQKPKKPTICLKSVTKKTNI